MRDGTIQLLVNAVNGLQAVPWRLNRGVLVVMRACAGNVEVGSLRSGFTRLFENRFWKDRPGGLVDHEAHL
jgi:hypothetical protein